MSRRREPYHSFLLRQTRFTLAYILMASKLFLILSKSAFSADLPPFLPFPELLSPEIKSEVVSVWSGYTLSRAVNGQPARAPLALFRLFIDFPEVTVAASRYLSLGHYRVRRIGLDSYEVQDGEGARGVYRVLFQDPGRRVILARGSRPGWVLGRITGASLTLLVFTARTDNAGLPWIDQRMETFVRIDNRIAAFTARLLARLFSRYADRKISEGFDMTATVSSWAYENPKTFCHWLSAEKEVATDQSPFAAYCTGINGGTSGLAR